MKLYVAYCEDRHLDPVIRVFSKRQAAIDFARNFMEAHVSSPKSLVQEDVAGYEFFLGYQLENDNAWVQEVTLDDHSPA